MNDDSQPNGQNGEQPQPALPSQPVMAFGPDGEPPYIMIYANGNVDIKAGLSLNDAAIMFWKTIGQHSPMVMLREDATREINKAMSMLAALLYASGGRATISGKILQVLPQHLQVSRIDDPTTHDITLNLTMGPKIILPGAGM